MGVDQASPMWRAHHTLLTLRNQTRTTPVSDAAIIRRANVAQVLERARLKQFTNLPYAEKIRVLDGFDALLVGADYSIIEENNLRGQVLAEWMFITDPSSAKPAFKDGKRFYGKDRTGVAIPDKYTDANGMRNSHELKTDEIHLMVRPGEAAAAARDYARDAVRKRNHLPPNTTYSIHFVRRPFSPGAQEAMLRAMMGVTGQGVSEVRFGDGPWISLEATPTPNTATPVVITLP